MSFGLLPDLAQNTASGFRNHFLPSIFFSLQICTSGEISLQPDTSSVLCLEAGAVLAGGQRLLVRSCPLVSVVCALCRTGRETLKGKWGKQGARMF